MRALALTCLLLPGLARAEGARIELACVDAGGIAVDFTLAPVETDAAGAGDYLVSGSGTKGAAPALAASFAGPFTWVEAEARATLILDETSGTETRFLFHRLPLPVGSAPGMMQTLTCETAP